MRYLLICALLLNLSGCAYMGDLIDDYNTKRLEEKKKEDERKKKEEERKKQEEEERKRKEEEEREKPKYSSRHHHTNGDCHLEARKTACVILCPRDKATSCEMNGKKMKKHGAQDRGRDVWLGPWPAGDMICVIDGKKYKYKVESGMNFGTCR